MEHSVKPRSARLLVALAGSALLVSTLVAAAPAHMRGAGHDLFREEQMANRLDLDAQQREQLAALSQSNRSALRPHVKEMVVGHKRMRELTAANEFDEAAVRQAASAMSAATTEMAVLRARQRHQLRQLLRPEQREKFDHADRRHGHRP